MADVEWLNLQADGAKVIVARYAASKFPHDRAVVIEGPISAAASKSLTGLGFRQLHDDPPVYARPGGTFRLKEMRLAFPQVRRAMLPFKATRRDEPGPSPLDPTVGEIVGGFTRLNRYQVKYRPNSKLGEPIAAIPVNLAVPTAKALAAVEERNGSIDQFVAKRCGWSIAELAKALSPEQIDAVALSLDAMDREQGSVLADAAGLGKGRVVAAILRAIVLADGQAIFLTERENLFSDIYRDIIDIGSFDLFGRPFILNNGSEIIGQDGLLHEPWDPAIVAKAVKTGKLPNNVKLVMATYSQFNRKGSPKVEFLQKIAKKKRVVADECHNAVGDSNTSESIGIAMDGAKSVTFSSATFAKNAKNLAAYKRLFPASMRSSDLLSVLSAGGQAMAEAFTQMLAEDGAYLRREHDLSGIKLEVVEDTARLERNRALADALSPVLFKIAGLARAAKSIADSRNGDTKDEGPKAKRGKDFWYAANFGSGLSVVMRQFTTALLVDSAVEMAIDLLDKGEKPVIVIESTMESLMRELLLAGEATEASEESDEFSVPPELMEDAAEQTGAKPPTFRDTLRLLLDRTMTLRRKVPNSDPEKVPIDDPDLLAQAEELKALIDVFPDLSLSLIDDIRDRIEAAGAERGKTWNADEISARSMRVINGEYVQVPHRNRVNIVTAFNAGEIDALIITRSGSTGLSLHASEKFRDQRRRWMIELQIAANVAERVQFLGRVNRRGQVSIPGFLIPSTGLPLQTRNLSNQNRKMADLSANVTGSAQSATEIDVPDLIDSIGNEVCRRMLEERPALAERMFIAMKLQDPEKAASELYHVDKFLSRLVLFSSDEQDRLYEELTAGYQALTADLAAQGRSPRGARELDGSWSIVARDIYEAGDPRDGDVFGRTVTVTTLERLRDARPLRANAMSAAIEAAEEATPRNGVERFPEHHKQIGKRRKHVLHAALSKRHINTDQALADRNDNAVKVAERRIEMLLRLTAACRPGCIIQVPGEDGMENGLVIDVRPPADMANVTLPGQWTVRYAVPGDERPRTISAATIQQPDSRIVIHPWRGPPNPVTLALFDAAPSGLVPEQRKVLDGNIVRAVITARNQKWGSSVLWTDSEGAQHRAMLVPKNKQDHLHILEGRTTSSNGAVAALNAGGELTTDADNAEERASIMLDGDDLVVRFDMRPKTAKAFQTDKIMAVTGPFSGARERFAHVPRRRIQDLVEVFLASGHAFHYPGRLRGTVAAATSAATPQEDEPAPTLRM